MLRRTFNSGANRTLFSSRLSPLLLPRMTSASAALLVASKRFDASAASKTTTTTTTTTTSSRSSTTTPAPGSAHAKTAADSSNRLMYLTVSSLFLLGLIAWQRDALFSQWLGLIPPEEDPVYNMFRIAAGIGKGSAQDMEEILKPFSGEERKAIVNAVDPTAARKTPLMVAAERGRPEIVQYLLACDGVDPAKRDGLGFTALHLAAAANHPECAAALLDHNPELLLVRSPEGATPLAIAAFLGSVETLTTLIGGANAKGKEMKNPHLLKEMLLSRDNQGNSCLAAAVAFKGGEGLTADDKERQVRAIKLILAAGGGELRESKSREGIAPADLTRDIEIKKLVLKG